MAGFRPRHPLPSWEWPAAFVAHGFVFLTVAVARCGDDGALFKQPEPIMVELVAASQASRMPQRAERAPDVNRGTQNPDAAKPPPNPSELALPTEPTRGSQSDTRSSLLDELRREELLKDLSAEVGTTDRAASSGETTEGAGNISRAGVRDPALSKWVQAAQAIVDKNFHPLPALCAANRSLLAEATVSVLPDGTIDGDASVSKSSGTGTFDGACRQAFANTGKLPPTPPNHPDGLDAVLTCVCPQ
ncbi:MAG: energy transducer TonB [Deltaproteobacteria bacterium]|nr:energy transducer TonB [Deltaproteobacteria bacterium]